MQRALFVGAVCLKQDGGDMDYRDHARKGAAQSRPCGIGLGQLHGPRALHHRFAPIRHLHRADHAGRRCLRWRGGQREAEDHGQQGEELAKHCGHQIAMFAGKSNHHGNVSHISANLRCKHRPEA